MAADRPWEGLTNPYRDGLADDVPRTAFPAFVRDNLYGRARVEDPVAMLAQHPLADACWEDEIPGVAGSRSWPT